MDAFDVLDGMLRNYQAVVQGVLNVRDDRVRVRAKQETADGLLWPEPWLSLDLAFQAGRAVGDLVAEGCCTQVPPDKDLAHLAQLTSEQERAAHVSRRLTAI